MSKKKEAPKPAPRETAVITMVVDASESMNHLFDATVGGFNEYVKTLQKDLGGESYLSVLTFNSFGIAKLQVGAPLARALTLSRDNYHPEGMTPLLDAVGRAIRATDEVMEQQKGTKAIVVIQTDGEENTSREFSLDALKLAIEQRQGKGWQFVFIGAGINAFADASRMGIHGVNTMSYTNDAHGTRKTFGAMAQNTRHYAAGVNASMAFTAQQSADAGEDAHITMQKMAGTPPPKHTPVPPLDLTK